MIKVNMEFIVLLKQEANIYQRNNQIIWLLKAETLF